MDCEFNEMVDDLLEKWHPATTTEKMVSYKMVEQYWLSVAPPPGSPNPPSVSVKMAMNFSFSNQIRSPDARTSSGRAIQFRDFPKITPRPSTIYKPHR
jgi:hypothetical protein